MHFQAIQSDSNRGLGPIMRFSRAFWELEHLYGSHVVLSICGLVEADLVFPVSGNLRRLDRLGQVCLSGRLLFPSFFCRKCMDYTRCPPQ